MSKSATFQRARSPQHKQERREAILAATRELAVEKGVRNVSLGDIATSVGLAKSNVLRYFGTREEIFLSLTAEGWSEWQTALRASLGTGPSTPAEVADAFAVTLAERPLFCDLLSQTSTNLEHNVTLEAARDFKHSVITTFGEIAELVTQVLPGITPGQAAELVGATFMLATSLWPAANPPATIAALYESDPVAAAACVDFRQTMRRLVIVLIAGAAAAEGESIF